MHVESSSTVSHFCRNDNFRGRYVLEILATPAGIEAAAKSLEVVRKASSLNAHSDKTALPAALFNKTIFRFVGMVSKARMGLL